MTKKKIADTEPSVPKKPRAPRSSAKTVTHKHKKTAAPVTVTPVEVEPAVMAAPAPVVAAPQPIAEQIARLAYSYWEARGYQGGSPESDWARAEQEIHKR